LNAIFRFNGKAKLILMLRHKLVRLHAFKTSAPDEGEWPVSPSSRFISGEILVPVV
jgi:hypothetical protein